MTTWNERLVQAMKEKDISAAQLSRATGISAAGMKKWVDGVTLQPKYEDVIVACKALSISPQWLMSGEASCDQKMSENTVTVEKLDLQGSCGFGKTNWDVVPSIKRIAVDRDWFSREFPYLKAENIKVITATGDSMSPLIEDNDAVFIDIKDIDFLREGVYAVLLDGELFIKRLQRMAKRAIRLKSENPKYDPIDIFAEDSVDFRLVGRVVKAMKFQDV